jgi:hypothetical protein
MRNATMGCSATGRRLAISSSTSVRPARRPFATKPVHLDIATPARRLRVLPAADAETRPADGTCHTADTIRPLRS